MISIPKCWSSGLAESRAEAGFTGLDMLAGKLEEYVDMNSVICNGNTARHFSIYLSICGVGVLPSKRPGFYNE